MQKQASGGGRLAPSLIAGLLALTSCASGVLVNRDESRIHRVSRVGVLLFEHGGGAAERQQAEIVTEVFSIQMRRYFPALVERFEIEEVLAERKEPVPKTLTPERARQLGEIFDCEAFFTGRITAMKERSSLLGLRGSHQFGLAVSLVSAKTGEVLLAGTVDSEGSFLLPLETPREIAIYSVRKLVEEFGFDEGGPYWLTRQSPLWQAAMRAYEEQRFWDAATLFGEVVSQYPVNLLTEEAYLYLGRSFYELALYPNAERAWCSLIEVFPKSEFNAMARGELTALAFRQGNFAKGDSLLAMQRRARAGKRAEQMALYAAGISARRAGDYPAALRYLASVKGDSEYGPFARYATAECLVAQGREEHAIGDLRQATRGAAQSRAHAVLAGEAWIALGRRQLQLGDNEHALSDFSRVDPRDDTAGRAALGRAWANVRLGELGAAYEALSAARGFTGLGRLEAPLLEAMALSAAGDADGTEKALTEVRLGIDWLSRRSVADAQRTLELIEANLGEFVKPAWLASMRRPGPERRAECERIGAQLPLLVANRREAREELELARGLEAEREQIAAIEEGCELLLANVLLLRERGALVRRDGAGRDAVTTGGSR